MLECASFEYLRSYCANAYYSRELFVVHVVAASFPREEYLSESSGLTMSRRGTRVSSAAKAIIFNVYKYFEWQVSKSKYRGPPQVMCKTAEATGYPERTVRRIAGEKASLCGAAFASPAKRYKVDRRTVCLDDFNVEAIRRVVHDFYREKKYPMLDSLLLAVKEKGLFGGEHATLWRILRKMGFNHKEVNDKRYRKFGYLCGNFIYAHYASGSRVA